ncbi:MAG: tRNA 2-thiocytidine biosynthesis protein TtcA [Ruminococcus sp.]|nr:tRNA 2-thiocytidine biosynthesis protein TtcA [Ruminococcus sp.]
MKERSAVQQIERSITKTYRDTIWNPFIRAMKQYELVREGDKVAVCISGGKDSMLLAKLMQMLRRYSDFPFELEFLVMDPGYNAENLARIVSNAKLLEIPITVFETNIFDVADKAEKYPCYLCAKMRRGHLYKKAQELGCNKIALGHHFSDVIETTVMSLFYGSQLQGMMPKLHSTNYEGMELIRPLYCVHEEDIIKWCRYNDLEFIRCACKVTERIAHSEDDVGDSKRQEIKLLLKELKKTNPNIEKSIFNAIHAVHIDTFPGYKSKGQDHSFLDDYDKM